ncbi:PaaX family transcriptional regulator C-terminal domain-containing protein [Microbacterium sediminicola]|uniref:PaaX family transcriptional regulator C-terminal domain-containing protein n=1 Tax=Microbacterium sediminicola TaxID=415210 RepID=A0ABN2IAH6_9MICO
MSEVDETLDDIDSRPGSTTSLLRSVIGIYLRELDEWIAVADLLQLMDALDVPAPRARTAIARVKKKGLLRPEARGGVAGYRLAPEARVMLSRGDRRIYHPRHMDAASPWCLVSFSIPEDNRSLRHQLRRRLLWIGCGTVSPALWIAPAYLLDEVEDILSELGVRERATVFVADEPRVAGSLALAVTGWWDLDEIRAHHDEFLAGHSAAVIEDAATSREAFATYIRGIDAWRIIPYVDPGLPPQLLPADWPGEASTTLLLELRARFSGPATDYVSEVVGRRVDNPSRAAFLAGSGQR